MPLVCAVWQLIVGFCSMLMFADFHAEVYTYEPEENPFLASDPPTPRTPVGSSVSHSGGMAHLARESRRPRRRRSVTRDTPKPELMFSFDSSGWLHLYHLGVALWIEQNFGSSDGEKVMNLGGAAPQAQNSGPACRAARAEEEARGAREMEARLAAMQGVPFPPNWTRVGPKTPQTGIAKLGFAGSSGGALAACTLAAGIPVMNFAQFSVDAYRWASLNPL